MVLPAGGVDLSFVHAIVLWDAKQEMCSPPRTQRISDRGLKSISESFAHLTSLSIAGHHWLTRQEVAASLSVLVHLKSLCLRGMSQLGSDDVAGIVKGTRALEQLDLFGLFEFADDGLLKVAKKHGETLVELNIGGCARLTEEALAAVAPPLCNLRKLGLAHIPAVTDGVVEAFCQRNQSLPTSTPTMVPSADHGIRELDLSFCTQVTDEGMRLIEQHCKSSLVTISVRRCPLITDFGAVLVATGCKAIRRVDLSWCERVSTPSVWGDGEIAACRREIATGEDQWVH